MASLLSLERATGPLLSDLAPPQEAYTAPETTASAGEGWVGGSRGKGVGGGGRGGGGAWLTVVDEAALLVGEDGGALHLALLVVIRWGKRREGRGEVAGERG